RWTSTSTTISGAASRSSPVAGRSARRYSAPMSGSRHRSDASSDPAAASTRSSWVLSRHRPVIDVVAGLQVSELLRAQRLEGPGALRLQRFEDHADMVPAVIEQPDPTCDQAVGAVVEEWNTIGSLRP